MALAGSENPNVLEEVGEPTDARESHAVAGATPPSRDAETTGARAARAASRSAVDLPAALARPQAYPGPPHRVTVRETHISWVFLAGAHAYKLKKPLLLPFLDYRTPRRRHRMCREEVRLNRRLAPEVYIGVRAVIEGQGGIALAEEDDPRAIDYVVEMRRYDEGTTMAARLARGELRRPQAIAAGQALASFHRHAPRVRAGNRAATLRQVMGDNCRELLNLLSELSERADIQRMLALERFLSAFLAAHTELLERRARAGLVREGHGDLRADHVLLDGEVQVVDCIEFDKRLRELDVADDVSFLVMDLTRRGGERYARALLDAYRAAGGDAGEEKLVAFYAVHRALVSAKVTLLRAAQCAPGSSGRGQMLAGARELIVLAGRYAWRARGPLLLVICGLPASGKSELASRLAAASGFTHLNSDIVRKRLAGVEAHRRAPAEIYSADWDRRTYAALGFEATQALTVGGGVIVDATFRHRLDRDAFARAFGASAPALFVECRVASELLVQRAAQRTRDSHSVSDATPQVVMHEQASWEPLEEVAPDAHLMVRGDRPPEAVIAELAALLDCRLARQREPLASPAIR